MYMVQLIQPMPWCSYHTWSINLDSNQSSMTQHLSIIQPRPRWIRTEPGEEGRHRPGSRQLLPPSLQAPQAPWAATHENARKLGGFHRTSNYCRSGDFFLWIGHFLAIEAVISCPSSLRYFFRHTESTRSGWVSMLPIGNHRLYDSWLRLIRNESLQFPWKSPEVFALAKALLLKYFGNTAPAGSSQVAVTSWGARKVGSQIPRNKTNLATPKLIAVPRTFFVISSDWVG